MAAKRFVIVGDGAAGLAAAQRLRRQHPTALVGVFTDDPNPGYYRAALTNYLLGELREDQLWAVSPDFYEAFGIRRIFGRVVGIDTRKSCLWDTTSSTPTEYDRLLVASGARPRPPTFEGAHLQGVMTLRTIQDARLVMDFVHFRRVERAVVVGGGPLGLEWAHALADHGVSVTILERSQRFLPAALDSVGSDLLAARLRQRGIEVVFGESVAAAHHGPDGCVCAVTLQSGRVLYAGLVAAALGVVPASEFLHGSAVALDQGGAVLADRQLRTNVENVWAAGDVARVAGQQLQLWEPARQQARVAADNMVGREAFYQPGVHYFATRLFDLDFARLGSIDRGPEREEIVAFPRGTGTIAYRKLVLESGKLVGALMIGERASRVRAAGRRYKKLIDTGVDVSAIRDKLLDPGFDFDGWLGTQKLFDKPVGRSLTALVKAAKMRGTQVVSLAALPPSALGGSGTSLVSDPARAPIGGTSVLPPPASRASSAPPPGSVPAVSFAAAALRADRSTTLETQRSPRNSRMLSIGLNAEAPAPPRDLPSLGARLQTHDRVIPIEGALFGLGSDASCQLCVDEPGVASLHAQIARQGDELYLRDAGSQTGTWVNDRPLVGSHRLRDRDRVRIGSLELELSAPSLGAAPAVAPASAVPVPHLEVRSGHALGLSFVLEKDSLLVGSAPGADVQLNDLSVAREHARLERRGQAIVLVDLGGGLGTWVAGMALAPGQEVALAEGNALRLGAVDLVFSRRPVLQAAAALRPRGQLRVDAGPATGRVLPLGERVLIGSAAGAALELPGAAPEHLEIVLRGGSFVVRDLSGGQTFKGGAPLGRDPAELVHGDLLLLAGGTMLRFEEAS